MFACEPVGLEFLDEAPLRLRTDVRVGRPPRETFAAFAHDPANWGEFFPGFDRTGVYLTPEPHGVGSRYLKRFLGLTIEEKILAWEEGERFAFRVEGSAAPVFHAWVEDYRFEPDGPIGTLLRVTIGGRPRAALKLIEPLLPRTLTRVFGRAGRNIERGRWFSGTT